MNEFTELLNRIAERFPTRQALATALDINASRLSRALNGSDTLTFNIENCLLLARVSGEPASTVLRAAGKGDIATLIEGLYGKEKRVTDPAVRDLLKHWPTFTGAEKTYVRSSVAMVLRARQTTTDARSESGVRDSSGAHVPLSRTSAKSGTNADGRDRAKASTPHAQPAAVPAGAASMLRESFDRAKRALKQADAAAATARARPAGRAARARKPRR